MSGEENRRRHEAQWRNMSEKAENGSIGAIEMAGRMKMAKISWENGWRAK
jgi:hypothetical protein